MQKLTSLSHTEVAQWKFEISKWNLPMKQQNIMRFVNILLAFLNLVQRLVCRRDCGNKNCRRKDLFRGIFEIHTASNDYRLSTLFNSHRHSSVVVFLVFLSFNWAAPVTKPTSGDVKNSKFLPNDFRLSSHDRSRRLSKEAKGPTKQHKKSIYLRKHILSWKEALKILKKEKSMMTLFLLTFFVDIYLAKKCRKIFCCCMDALQWSSSEKWSRLWQISEEFKITNFPYISEHPWDFIEIRDVSRLSGFV